MPLRNHAKPRPLSALPLFVLAAIFLLATAAHAQHNHDHIEFPTPSNFVEASSQILEIVGHLRSDLENGEYEHIHDDSIILARVARMLGRFALNPESGVARPHVREVNVAGRELALLADALHDAADGKSETECRRHLSAMNEHLDIIEANLRRITEPVYSVVVTSAEPRMAADREEALTIEIQGANGKRVASFDRLHGEYVHVIVVSDDLGWFAHHHPPLGSDGRFVLPIQFPAGGRYRMFHDFKPAGLPEAHATVDIEVEGPRGAKHVLEPNVDAPQRVGDYEIEPHGVLALYADHVATLRFIIRRNGEPHIGSHGHLVAVSQSLEHIVHAHPSGAHDHDHGHNDHAHDGHGHDEQAQDAGDLSFRATFPEPGLYRMWLEFKDDDQIRQAPFTVQVLPAAAHGEHDRNHDHDHRHDHDHGDGHGHSH